MELIGGTQRASKWIAALKADGNLIDVYSDEWFDDQDAGGHFTPATLAGMASAYGPEFRNHLLLIYLTGCTRAARDELVAIYPPLGELIGTPSPEPAFLFINLKLQKILCVGLGSQNQLFVADAATTRPVDAYGLLGHGDRDYMTRFAELDCDEIIEDLVAALHNLGVALSNFALTPGNPDTVHAALSAGAGPDRLFHIEGEDQAYSREELLQFIEDYEESEHHCNAAMAVINFFFPQCEIDALINTGAA